MLINLLGNWLIALSTVGMRALFLQLLVSFPGYR